MRDSLLSFHNVPQNIVDSGKVAFALRLQPGEHARFEAHAHGTFGRISHNRTICANCSSDTLLIGQMGNVVEVDAGIVPCRLLRGSAP
jgi:hypothetical protein